MKIIKILRVFSGRKTLVLAGFFPAFQTEPIDFEKYREARGLLIENNWERVKTIFSKDDYGNWHPEMYNAIQMTQYGMFIGGIFGGLINSIRRYEEFLKNNDTTKFFSDKDAKRKLFNHNLLNFYKGAFRWAPRFAIFLGGYTLLSSCLETYRNKSGIIEYTIGGCGIGALFKFNYGMKGMISGGVVGSIIGTLYGSITYFILKLLKKDVLEVKYAQYALSLQRKELYDRLSRQSPLEDLDVPSGKHHIEHIEKPLDSLTDSESSNVPTEKKLKNMSAKISQNTNQKTNTSIH